MLLHVREGPAEAAAPLALEQILLRVPFLFNQLEPELEPVFGVGGALGSFARGGELTSMSSLGCPGTSCGTGSTTASGCGGGAGSALASPV